MYSVYVLFSLKDNGLYIGQTQNLVLRLREHNSGKVKSTKSRRPLKLIYRQDVVCRKDALELEKKWKSSTGRRKLRKILEKKFEKYR